MTGFALAVSLGTLAAGLALALVLRRLPTVRLQLAGLALLAVALPLGSVILAGLVMFHMHDDVKVLAVAAASASTAVAAALLLGGGLARRDRRARGAAGRISGGELHARAPDVGPARARRASAAPSTRWRRTWSSSSTRGASWSRPRATTCARRWRRSRRCSRPSEDGLVPIEHYLPALQEQTRFLALLIDDLFELARIDAAALTLDLEEARLPQIVDACVRGLDAEARARRVRLASELDDDLPAVRCAPEQVQRVLFNLLTNALRHTPSDGSVVVRARVAAEELEVLVEDTGSGLAAGAEQRVFERFWRADGSRTRSTGGAGPRPRDRARVRRGAGRPHLGREPLRRRRALRVHAAGGLLVQTAVHPPARAAPDRGGTVGQGRESPLPGRGG